MAADLTKKELEALAYCVANWARCLPPMGKDIHRHPAIRDAQDKVRAAREALKKLRAAAKDGGHG